MKNLKFGDKVRTFAKTGIFVKLKTFMYMLIMICVVLGADTMVTHATSDDGALSDSILSGQSQDNENKTNINDPGSAETGDD